MQNGQRTSKYWESTSQQGIVPNREYPTKLLYFTCTILLYNKPLHFLLTSTRHINNLFYNKILSFFSILEIRFVVNFSPMNLKGKIKMVEI